MPPDTIEQSLGKWVFSVDSPNTDKVSVRRIVASGWCYHKSGEPIAGIRVTLRQAHYDGIHGLPRPDVSKHLKDAPGTLSTGFRIALPLRPGLNELQFEACGEKTGWIPFTRKSIRCEPTPRLRRWRVWVRFAFRFLTSFRKAWEQLPVEEKGALHLFLQSRELFQLGRYSQYVPREVFFSPLHRFKVSVRRLPRISIVTPSYNQGGFLRQTMESVLDQNYPKLDYFVVDGGSKDESAGLIAAFASRLKYSVSEPDKGQADALRKGFSRVCCGPDDILAYLNSDDLLVPGVLQFVANYFSRNPTVDVVYGHRIVIDKEGRETGRWISPRHDPEMLQLVDYVPQETMFWRKRLYDKVGGIDPTLKFAMDWDLLLRFQEAGAVIARIPHFLGCFRVHARQKTRNQINESGLTEMNALRRRCRGREPSYQELSAAIECAQVESGILMYLLRRGIRI